MRFWDSCAAWVSFGLAALGISLLAFWLFWGYRQSGDDFNIESAEDAGSEAAGYLASYLLPFFQLEVETWRDWVVYGGFFFTAATIYVNSSIMRINPTLYMVGYRVVQVVDKTGARNFLITRRPVVKGDEIKAVDMSGGLLLLKSIQTEK